MQIPIGEEGQHEGCVDLLTMKAYTFSGNMGEEVIEGEIPANLLEDAKKYRAELIERIVEQDDAAMGAYLEGKEPPLDELKAILRKAVIHNEIFPVYCGSALKNKGVQLVLDAVVEKRFVVVAFASVVLPVTPRVPATARLPEESIVVVALPPK